MWVDLTLAARRLEGGSALTVCSRDDGPPLVRSALGEQPPSEPLIAPGHFAFEIMSALRAAANRPGHPFTAADLRQALQDAESYEIAIEGTPWTDVHRAWALSERSLRFADAIYVAAAERHQTSLLTADSRTGRSGAVARCQIITVVPAEEALGDAEAGSHG